MNRLLPALAVSCALLAAQAGAPAQTPAPARGTARTAAAEARGGDAYTHDIRRDFGASGSAATYTGAVAAGSRTLALTAPGDFSRGQGILVAAAGPAGTDLLTTVADAEGTRVTLAAPATTTVAAALVQHDETAAVQASLDRCASAGGCSVLWPEGTYRVNGPLKPACNAQLCYPPGGAAGEVYTVRWAGRFVNRNYEGSFPTHGTRVISDRVAGAGEYPAFISAAPWADTFRRPGAFNPVNPVVENFFFVGKVNPSISVLNWNQAMSGRVSDSFFVTHEADPQTEPTHEQATAVILPGANNHVLISATRTSVFGYHNGYRASEGARFHDTYAYRAKRGYVIAPSNGDISGLIGAAHCTTAVHFEGAAVVNFHLSFERWNQAGRWYHSPPGGDITAGAGVVPFGKIEYKLNLPGLGTTPTDLSTTGTGSMNLINLTTGKSTKWASLP